MQRMYKCFRVQRFMGRYVQVLSMYNIDDKLFHVQYSSDTKKHVVDRESSWVKSHIYVY